MARTKDALHQQHLAEAEKIIIRRRSYYDAMTSIVEKFGIDDRTARRWIEQVRARWKVEGKGDIFDRTLLRVEMHHALNLGIALALNRTTVLKDKDGRIVWDPATVERAKTTDGSKGEIIAGKPTIRPNPDLQRYFYGLATLARLHGLDEPAKVKIEMDGELNLAPDLSKIAVSDLEKIRELLKTIAPGGDVDALIGDWTGEGEAPRKRAKKAKAPAKEPEADAPPTSAIDEPASTE